MNKVALLGGLASIGEVLATCAGALNPQILLPSIIVTLTVTVAINVTINK